MEYETTTTTHRFPSNKAHPSIMDDNEAKYNVISDIEYSKHPLNNYRSCFWGNIGEGASVGVNLGRVFLGDAGAIVLGAAGAAVGGLGGGIDGLIRGVRYLAKDYKQVNRGHYPGPLPDEPQYQYTEGFIKDNPLTFAANIKHTTAIGYEWGTAWDMSIEGTASLADKVGLGGRCDSDNCEQLIYDVSQRKSGYGTLIASQRKSGYGTADPDEPDDESSYNSEEFAEFAKMRGQLYNHEKWATTRIFQPNGWTTTRIFQPNGTTYLQTGASKLLLLGVTLPQYGFRIGRKAGNCGGHGGLIGQGLGLLSGGALGLGAGLIAGTASVGMGILAGWEAAGNASKAAHTKLVHVLSGETDCQSNEKWFGLDVDEALSVTAQERKWLTMDYQVAGNNKMEDFQMPEYWESVELCATIGLKSGLWLGSKLIDVINVKGWMGPVAIIAQTILAVLLGVIGAIIVGFAGLFVGVWSVTRKEAYHEGFVGGLKQKLYLDKDIALSEQQAQQVWDAMQQKNPSIYKDYEFRYDGEMNEYYVENDDGDQRYLKGKEWNLFMNTDSSDASKMN